MLPDAAVRPGAQAIALRAKEFNFCLAFDAHSFTRLSASLAVSPLVRRPFTIPSTLKPNTDAGGDI